MNLLISLLFATSPALADHPVPQAESGAEFLRVGVSARASAMGEAQTAVADDASALYFNPAALTRVPGRSATFMHASYLEATKLNYGAYGQRLGRGAFGASVQHMSAGTIEAIDDQSLTIGEISPAEMAVSLGYAHRFGPAGGDGFSIGAAGKLVRSTIRDSAQTASADVGLLSPAFLGRRLRIGASMSNLVGKLRYAGEAAGHPLPRIARVGAAFAATRDWSLALDAVREDDDKPYANAGTEYRLQRNEAWTFAVRGGFSTRDIGDVDRALGLAGGFGVDFKAVGVDYAFMPMGSFGTAHRVSLNFTF